MRSWSPQVVFQEVPDHISLAFTISGCPLKCEGCHSQDTWAVESGDELNDELFTEHLMTYQGLVSCVVFFGGEWWPDCLIRKLRIAQGMGFKTCLYSGFEQVPNRIKRHLDFVKLGAYQSKLGGLCNPKTNQTFIDLSNGECLNHRFYQSPITTNIHQERLHDFT